MIESFLPVISGLIGGAASAGIFKGPIETVQDWWYVNFGHNMNEQANMLRAKQAVNIDKYKHAMLKEISKIEPENVKEPELKILGPAIEASKYYIEDESLRIMFAKLIAASMDKSKEDIVHSSYVEIIKQLTPLDAENLLAIHSNKNSDIIASLKINLTPDGFINYYKNLYLGNPNTKNQILISPSLDNLARLGLVSLTYQEHRNDKTIYDQFQFIEEYQQTLMYIKNQNEEHERLRNIYKEHPGIEYSSLPELSGPEIEKGLVTVTGFGKNFCATCL